METKIKAETLKDRKIQEGRNKPKGDRNVQAGRNNLPIQKYIK